MNTLSQQARLLAQAIERRPDSEDMADLRIKCANLQAGIESLEQAQEGKQD